MWGHNLSVNTARTLMSGRLLARNVLWNLMGTGMPLVVAVFAIPVLISGFGTERFGLLAIIWVAIGYFSLFDLGLGRSLTKFVAERLGREDVEEVPHLILTALTLMGGIGVAVAVGLAILTPWLVTEVLNVPPSLQIEGQYSFWIMAGGLPFVILSSGLIGLLEAYQLFKAVSLVRAALGMLTFLGPLVALQWTTSLAVAIAVLAAARLLSTAAYVVLCLRYVPSMRNGGRMKCRLVRPLLVFGGWLTVSNVVGPLMVNLDRFLIGAVLTMSAVAYYTTPYEVVTRLWIFPVSLVGVLFPAFTTALATQQDRLEVLFRRANRVVMLAMVPLVAVIILFAPEGLRIWVGEEFARQSGPILRWLAVGVLINSMARLPHAMVQSADRPDIIAKVHLAELPLYLVTLWFLLHIFGIVGAAITWTVRIGVDTLLFYLFGARLVPIIRPASIRALVMIVLVSGGMGLLLLPMDLAIKIGCAGVVLSACGILGWREFKSTGLWHPKVDTVEVGCK